jgi:hypothetical protein
MLRYLLFFSLSSKCRLFQNATWFGSCIIHILNAGVLKFEKKKSGAKGLMRTTIFFDGAKRPWRKA